MGPATSLVLLDIALDSVNQVTRLPADKLQALQASISSWTSWRWCNKCQLESIIGPLHHTANVVWPGCSFIHRIIDLLSCFHKADDLYI